LTTTARGKIDERGISGTLTDFARLAELVTVALGHTMPGSMAIIQDEFVPDGSWGRFLDVKPKDIPNGSRR
jgi:hypothetical protein